MISVPVYIILSPEFPEQRFVSSLPPSAERARALRAEGCTIWEAVVEIPAEQAEPARAATPRELSLLGRRVRSCTGMRGTVVAETPTEVVIEWPNGTRGTFYRSPWDNALANGTLELEEQDGKEEATTQDGAGTAQP